MSGTEWAREPDEQIKYYYDLTWGENGGHCLYQDEEGCWHNGDPDEGGLPNRPLVPVEAMVRRREQNYDGEWEWEFAGYATVDEIPRGAYVWISGDLGSGWIKHKSAEKTIETMWHALRGDE